MGKFRVEINGLNIGRLLNNLSAKNIDVYELKKTDFNKIVLSVDSCNFKLLQTLVKCNGLSLSVVGGRGVSYIIKNYWYRFGLLIGLILSIIGIVVATGYYWNINVVVDSGNQAICEEVVKLLEERGVSAGLKIQEIQSRSVEKYILEKIEDVAVVVVTQKGVNVEVFVKESTKQSNLTENGIVASFSGVIEEIKLTSGNLLVNIGDAVTEGQLLISSSKVGDVFMEAHGTIVARVQIDGDAVGSLEQISVKRTGNFVEVVQLEALGKRFYCSKLKESDAELCYPNYEVEVVEVDVSENNLLPIKKIITRYYEIEEICVTIDYEQLINDLSGSAYKIAKDKLPVGAEELSVSYNVTEENSLYRVVCLIETRVDIAKREVLLTEE